MQSIILRDSKDRCYVCSLRCQTEEHHIFGGPDRDVSERNGLKVHLCLAHHRGTYGVHGTYGKEIADQLHEIGQRTYEFKKMEAGMSAEDARQSFREEFRKSYL